MSTPMDILWQFLGNMSQTTASHIGKRMDRAAGLHEPPALPQMPPMTAMPQWPPAPWQNAPAVAAPVVGAAVGATAATKADPRDEVQGSYSDQVAQGIACLACTDGHINGMTGAIDQAQTAFSAGDILSTRKYLAFAAAELDAMTVVDWDPEKLQRSPARDVKIIEGLRGHVTDLRGRLETPVPIGVALGLAKENRRFAVSPQQTPQDREEIQLRVRIISRAMARLERIDPPDLNQGDAQQALDAIRKARHVVDRAHQQQSLYAVETHQDMIGYLETAATALTPEPTKRQIKAIAKASGTCSDAFYTAYFAKGEPQ